jgi:hypothetical protein
MTLARITFKFMVLITLLATAQVFLVHVSAGLLAAVEGADAAQNTVLCIMQGISPNICAEGLK